MQCDPNLVFTFGIRNAVRERLFERGSPLPSTLLIIQRPGKIARLNPVVEAAITPVLTVQCHALILHAVGEEC